ncbi:heparan-alpha-glucosaminide N-acetyltransferase domain-containing protein, partial [Melaminivora alkalimesophila]
PAPLLAGPLPRGAAPLAWLGRHSLIYYMLHQPVMIGALLVWEELAR